MAGVLVSVGGSSAQRTSTAIGSTATVTTVTSASKLKVGKLEDNVGNIDKGDDGILATGETILYNAETEKWETVSLDDKVSEAVSDQIDDSVNDALSGDNVTLDGGTF